MPLVEGIDESTGAGLLQTHLYCNRDVLLGHRFGDLVSSDSKGRKQVNIRRLNHVIATR